jgi:transposase
MCAKRRKTYTDNFKRQAVKMTEENGVTVKEVARRLDLAEAQLSQWRRKFLNVSPELIDQVGIYDDKDSNVPVERDESGDNKRINDLEKKVIQLTKERDILSQAVMIVGKNMLEK